MAPQPPGVGTSFLDVTCPGRHLGHSVQMSYAWLGIAPVWGHAMRVAYGDSHMWIATWRNPSALSRGATVGGQGCSSRRP